MYFVAIAKFLLNAAAQWRSLRPRPAPEFSIPKIQLDDQYSIRKTTAPNNSVYSNVDVVLNCGDFNSRFRALHPLHLAGKPRTSTSLEF